jgi:hypothetical protein
MIVYFFADFRGCFAYFTICIIFVYFFPTHKDYRLLALSVYSIQDMNKQSGRIAIREIRIRLTFSNFKYIINTLKLNCAIYLASFSSPFYFIQYCRNEEKSKTSFSFSCLYDSIVLLYVVNSFVEYM